MILVAVAALVVILMGIVLCRVYVRRLDPPPVAHVESGQSHLRGDR